MTILVVGSKGFIGQHALQFFRAQGHVVFGCDVVVEYNDDQYFQIDPTHAVFDELFMTHKIDVCINCSGAASVPDSFVHPHRDYHLNVANVYGLLEAIRRHAPACRFINLSSAAVYGNPQHLPVHETAISLPLSPYGWHKLYAEQICTEFHRYFEIPTCSLRIFSAYGVGLRKQIFWDWCQKVKRDKLLSVFGTGNESRDFIYVDDLIHAIDVVMRGAAFKAETINVASGNDTTIAEAANLFQAIYGEGVSYQFTNTTRAGDPVNWKADISQLQALGYMPRVTFKDGLTRYIQWAKGE